MSVFVLPFDTCGYYYGDLINQGVCPYKLWANHKFHSVSFKKSIICGLCFFFFFFFFSQIQEVVFLYE